MKKNNNKGFMMAELVIVSAVIVTTLTLLYATYSKMYIVYQERSNYYNIDASYAAKNIYTYLLKTNHFANLVKNLDVNGNKLIVQAKDNYNDNDEEKCLTYLGIDKDFCNIIVSTYNLKTAYIVDYSLLENNRNTFANFGETEMQKNYFNYLSTSLEYNDDNKYSYIIIVELNEDEYFYYGNYRVR